MTQATLDSESSRQLLRSITLLNVLFATQLILGLAYVYVTNITMSRLTHFFIPFIWITGSVWVLWRTQPSSARAPVKLLAGGIAIVYLLILFYFSGLVGPSTSHFEQLTDASNIGLTWNWLLGWSPVFIYAGEYITLTVVPYQAIGLVALSYLVYDALLEFARSTIGAVVGIAACPACVGPLFAPLLAGGIGGSSTVFLFGVYGYEVATVLFVAALVILYHRTRLTKRYYQLRAT